MPNGATDNKGIEWESGGSVSEKMSGSASTRSDLRPSKNAVFDEPRILRKVRVTLAGHIIFNQKSVKP